MRIPLLLTLFCIQLAAAAQYTSKDLKAALITLNGHLSGIAKVDVDHQYDLVLQLMEDGKPVRKDRIPVHDIDTTSIAYGAEEELVGIRCNATAAKCVDKEVMRSGARGPTGRSTLPVPAGDAQGERTVALLTQVVRIARSMAPAPGSRTKHP